MSRVQKGFTLIELMVVLAIIGVLVAAALPVYQDYNVRAKMGEVMQAASPCKLSVSEAYQTATASTSPAANAWGCESTNPSKYVGSIKTNANGVVQVAFKGVGAAALDGKAIYLVPQKIATDGTASNMSKDDMPSGIAKWSCGIAAADSGTLAKYLPATCKETVADTVAATFTTN